MTKKMLPGKLSLVACILALAATPATAGIINIGGVTNPDLLATVNFDYVDGSNTVNIAITNDSDPTSGAGPDPRITAFAFNARW